MKLLFSEYKSDYIHYIFPYAIWAIPEPGETPAKFFQHGFLPSNYKLERFYLCRQIRIKLNDFTPSSENRRILRKGAGIAYELILREDFDYSSHRREFCKNYADIKFGRDVMTYQRLDMLFHSRVFSHVLRYIDTAINQEVGLVTLYLEPPEMAFYYYAFYDLNYYSQNLGMYMMTSAVDFFRQQHFKYLYLGTCYSSNALYKTQFSGFEFFNGFSWSNSLKELKYLIQREDTVITQHLLETENYRERFYEGKLENIARSGGFKVI